MILLLKKKEGEGNITAPSATGNMGNAAGNFAKTVMVHKTKREHRNRLTYYGAGDTDCKHKACKHGELDIAVGHRPGYEANLGLAAEQGIMMEITPMMNR